MIFESILMLLAGSGVFIAGMNMMSQGLQKSAGKGMKNLLGRISNNKIAGVGIGAGVTGIIQSSAATTVMAIGFVNAGVMTLTQATAIIMGANIGTTVTGILVSLSSLDISLYASLLAFIGVMMTFFKKDSVKKIGEILCGLGLVFVGLDAMSGSLNNPEIKSFFMGIFTAIDFPLLLILCGMIFTALIQSSSAATGLVIIMAGQGAISIESALFIVLGSNIGTCVTALIASIGTTINARRTAIIHLLFNVMGTIVFTAFIWIFADWVVLTLASLIPNLQMQIAWFHVVFNVTTSLILLPFINHLVTLATRLVKDKPEASKERKLRYVDELLLKTPSIALMQVKKELEYIAMLAKDNIELSFPELIDQTGKNVDVITENEAIIDFTNKKLTRFLIELSPLVDAHEEKVIGSYFHVLNDLERIGDHAENFMDIGTQMKAEGLTFSDTAKAEIGLMHDEVKEMFVLATDAFEHKATDRLAELTAKENIVDGYKKKFNASHVERLYQGACTTDLSPYFFSTIAGLERVADHLVNVGYSIVSPVGSQSDN